MTEEVKKITIQSLLKGLVKYRASDLHVKVGRPPLYRVNGSLVPTKLPELSIDEVKNLAYATMTSKQIVEFESNQQIDFGYLVPGLARFRANIFMQKGTVAIVIRVVPLDVPNLETLDLPPVISELGLKARGLLLVTGATGSGKSTTMAALIDYINRNRRSHIISVEDPIEYVFEDKFCTVSQREIGTDALDMSKALRAAMRQDPDVICIGEMRDYETIHTALTAAETGHLVVSTLHTNSAAQSLDRILDSFPPEAKNQTRLMLASSLVGVINQRLVKKADGSGRVVACEVMTKSPSIEKLILDNKIGDILSVIESSNLYYKMQSMNQALEKLVKDGVITVEEAIQNSDRQEDLHLKLSGMLGGGHRGVDSTQMMSQTKGEKDDMNAAPEIDEEATNSGIKLDPGSAKTGLFAEKIKPRPAVPTGYSKASVVDRKKSA